MQPLPAPDQLSFELAPGHACLLSDDGSDLTVQTLRQLEARGWPVVVLRFPDPPGAPCRPLPAGVRQVQLGGWSEDQLQNGLAEADRLGGAPAVFVHLHPHTGLEPGVDWAFSPASKQVLQAIFLLAKHLKEPLNQAARRGRAALVLVARLDGQFGLGADLAYDPLGGGLFGLAKSLNLEWEPVFCRAVDLSPALSPTSAAALILDELCDPNRRLVEVAHTPTERTTLGLT